MKRTFSITAAVLVIGTGPVTAQETTWLLLSFDRKHGMGSPALSSQVIPMASDEQCQAEGARISKKFRHVRTEFACVLGISK